MNKITEQLAAMVRSDIPFGEESGGGLSEALKRILSKYDLLEEKGEEQREDVPQDQEGT